MVALWQPRQTYSTVYVHQQVAARRVAACHVHTHTHTHTHTHKLTATCYDVTLYSSATRDASRPRTASTRRALTTRPPSIRDTIIAWIIYVHRLSERTRTPCCIRQLICRVTKLAHTLVDDFALPVACREPRDTVLHRTALETEQSTTSRSERTRQRVLVIKPTAHSLLSSGSLHGYVC